MIRSMTGYGKGESTLYNRRFTVEIKSVNHRYNDITIKLPKALNRLEDRLRKLLSSNISRGKTDVYISLETFSKDDIKITLNEPLADAYVSQLMAIKERYSLSDIPTLSLISRFPDLISVEKDLDGERVMDELWEALQEAAKAALADFVSMRKNEGKALYNDIIKKLEHIHTLVAEVENRAPASVQEYNRRMKERITELLSGVAVDEARLLTECAMFADKSCVDEEVTRLKSHLSQLRQTLNEEEAIGRKLDFVVQEMNREVNTIGSKCNDIEMTGFVVELKSEIEKIREQIQNLE